MCELGQLGLWGDFQVGTCVANLYNKWANRDHRLERDSFLGVSSFLTASSEIQGQTVSPNLIINLNLSERQGFPLFYSTRETIGEAGYKLQSLLNIDNGLYQRFCISANNISPKGAHRQINNETCGNFTSRN